MNHSEYAALHFLRNTQALATDPTFNLADWSGTILIVSLAVLVFVCMLVGNE